MAIRAVLFDVGGPIDTEFEHERLMDAAIAGAFAREGLVVSSEELRLASEAAVSAFAPDAYAAIIWQLSARDRALAGRVRAAVAAGATERRATRGGLELRPGINGLLAGLHGRGLFIGLAANQPAAALAELRLLGLERWFAYLGVSGVHGFRKPDVRLFLHACDELGVSPDACVMVGDRVDNDVVPARLLGMRTVLFRTGRHVAQRPRSADEAPDAEVGSVPALDAALDTLLGR